MQNKKTLFQLVFFLAISFAIAPITSAIVAQVLGLDMGLSTKVLFMGFLKLQALVMLLPVPFLLVLAAYYFTAKSLKEAQ